MLFIQDATESWKENQKLSLNDKMDIACIQCRINKIKLLMQLYLLYENV